MTKQPVDFTDGRWIAMTTGQFCQILIDDSSKKGEAIVFRVLQDERVDDESFIRVLQVMQVPSGAIMDTIEVLNAATHKILQGFLQKGIME